MNTSTEMAPEELLSVAAQYSREPQLSNGQLWLDVNVGWYRIPFLLSVDISFKHSLKNVACYMINYTYLIIVSLS